MASFCFEFSDGPKLGSYCHRESRGLPLRDPRLCSEPIGEGRLIQQDLFLANERRTFLAGSSAQRAKFRDRIGQRDHRIWSGVLFAIEGRWGFRIETARLCVFRLVEPETNMERVCWSEAGSRIEAEDLIEQDGLDRDLGLPIAVCLNVGLVPGESEIFEIRIHLTAGKQISVLYREEIEAQIGFEMMGVQDEHIAQLAPLHDDVGARFRAVGHAQAVNKLRLWNEMKVNLGYL